MQQNKQITEKRRHPRIKKNIPIKIKNDDFDIVTETKNISCNGAYCQIDRYLAPLTKIKTRILVPSKTKEKHHCINCKGIVVRVERSENDLEDLYNVAIYFENINKYSLRVDKKYLAGLLKDGNSMVTLIKPEILFEGK